MSLREYSEEQIQEELQRRANIRDGDWPKKFNLLFKPEDEDELTDFLEDKCGFYENTDCYTKVLESLSELDLTIEISKDADIKVYTEDTIEINAAAEDQPE